MSRKRMKTATLLVIAGLLMLTLVLVIYADILLGRIYHEQQNYLQLSHLATQVPVLRATPSPTPAYSPTPVPTRRPLVGDLANISFPDYDTGTGADYSYQSNELRVAVNKVEEDGVTYFVADIWMRNINCFRTAFSSGKYKGKREAAEKIAKDNKAVLAVNGDFLGGLVIRNGILYRKAIVRPTPTPTPSPDPGIPTITPTPGMEELLRPQRATCVLYYNGQMITEEYSSFRSNKSIEKGAWQGWQFGPTLVRNGKAAKDVKPQGRNPRCILGYYEPGHYCIIMIDGRQKGYSIGMNFKEMISLSLKLGLKEAYNLDGGASAIMTFNGEIINSPSGSGEARNLPDMVIIGEYLDPGTLFEPTPSPTPKQTPTPEGATG